jgi:hypothetical protein
LRIVETQKITFVDFGKALDIAIKAKLWKGLEQICIALKLHNAAIRLYEKVISRMKSIIECKERGIYVVETIPRAHILGESDLVRQVKGVRWSNGH